MRVLLVDDDPELVMMARFALEKLGGFEVTPVSRGRDAVAVAKELRPDVILLDYLLEDMTGPQVLESLRREAPELTCPVVFLTAKSDSALHESLIAAGAKGVILKPFDPLELSDRVKLLLG